MNVLIVANAFLQQWFYVSDLAFDETITAAVCCRAGYVFDSPLVTEFSEGLSSVLGTVVRVDLLRFSKECAVMTKLICDGFAACW